MRHNIDDVLLLDRNYKTVGLTSIKAAPRHTEEITLIQNLDNNEPHHSWTLTRPVIGTLSQRQISPRGSPKTQADRLVVRIL